MKKAIVFGICLAFILSITMPLYAIEPPTGDHYTFNTVTEADPLADNEILVPLNGSGKLGFIAGADFRILDNDMTDGQAWVQVPAGLYDTFDQARGKPGGDLYWGNYHERLEGKPVWAQHNDPLKWRTGAKGNWLFTNNGITCYSFRLYPI